MLPVSDIRVADTGLKTTSADTLVPVMEKATVQTQ